ncbi:pentatricopeptide repeat-containing protein [Tanacetum coccineum]
MVTRASAEEEEVAYKVLEEIMSELHISPSSIKELCTNHISELCKKRNLRAAAMLLQLLRDKHSVNSLQAYNLLLVAAAETNDTEISSRVFKDMLVNHLQMNSTTYFNVAKAISMSNDFTLVQSFLKEISELINTGSLTVINRIIYAFAECGHDYNSMLVFDNMKRLNFIPDLVTYNTILGILGKAGRVDEMLDLFASMKRDKIAPDIYSYNTLLHSLRKVGRFDLCIVLIQEMGKAGLQPDLLTYTALIECLFKSGNIEGSLRLFEDMKRGHIRPSVYIYRSLVNNLEKLGKSELAIKFLNEMNDCQDDLVGPEDIKKKNDRKTSCI